MATPNRRKNRVLKTVKKEDSRKRNRRRGGFLAGPGSSSVISHRGVGIPSQFFTWLNYSQEYNLNSVGNATIGIRYHTNSAYDVDPTLGSATVVYFTELSALYTYNRTLAFKYDIQFVNLEAFPLSVYISNTNTEPGTSGTSNKYYAAQRLGQTSIIGASGGVSKLRVSRTFKVSEVSGARGVLYEDNYRGSSTSSPVDLTWLGIGLNCGPNDFTANNGVLMQINIYLHVQFYDPVVLTTFSDTTVNHTGDLQAFNRVTRQHVVLKSGKKVDRRKST